MKRTKVAIFGLLMMTVIASNAMNQRVSQEDLQITLRRLNDPYYMQLEQAINDGHEYTFMETLNDMDARGHSIDGDDFLALQQTAQNKGFDKFGITTDDVYQKLSAAVLRDDSAHFVVNLAEMVGAGRTVSDDHLFWLTDLAIRANSPEVKHILDAELQNRNMGL